jgi:hypothetical protein
MLPVIAHHAGEDVLAPLLMLLGGGGLSLALAAGRTRIRAVLDWFARLP